MKYFENAHSSNLVGTSLRWTRKALAKFSNIFFLDRYGNIALKIFITISNTKKSK